jgi:glyoxylase-like metal-dependent hydrolase (beta-lactamase superfamily II)
MEEQNTRLIKVTEHAGYVTGRVNAGVLTGIDKRCLVLDTGLDKSAANHISEALEAEGLRPVALLLTHTHADHCGGNSALQKKYGIPAYCAPLETAMLSFPILESVYLYGATPPEELRNKFFLAPATADARALAPGRQEIGGVPFTAVPLPGHSPDHYGYLSDDGALFLGDAALPGYVWEKYGLPYFYDIGAEFATLDALESMAGSIAACVAAHYGPVDLKELVSANRNGLRNLADWVLAALQKEPLTREGLVAKAFNQYTLMQNESQYYLVGSTVAALLTWLGEQGKISAKMEQGRLVYKVSI